MVTAASTPTTSGWPRSFYLQIGESIIVSNRYHLLFALARKGLGAKATLDIDVALSVLWGDSVMAQALLGKSLWSCITMLDHRSELIADRQGLRPRRAPRWRDLLDQPSRRSLETLRK